jgi:hypothetical protein
VKHRSPIQIARIQCGRGTHVKELVNMSFEDMLFLWKVGVADFHAWAHTMRFKAIIRCYGTLEEQRRLNAINPDFAIHQAPNPIFQPPPVRPGYVQIEDSAGAIYEIPAANLWYVFKRDPGVRVLPAQGLTSAGCLILSHELTAEDHTFLWDLKIGTGEE